MKELFLMNISMDKLLKSLLINTGPKIALFLSNKEQHSKLVIKKTLMELMNVFLKWRNLKASMVLGINANGLQLQIQRRTTMLI